MMLVMGPVLFSCYFLADLTYSFSPYNFGAGGVYEVHFRSHGW
jgi:hypothetical protein